ncbi:MAG: hypothetical protein AB8D78_10975 [Akkermansiaceae bacterium]
MKTSICIFLAIVCGFLSSCVPSTPQSRIQQRPQDFAQLSEKHKELVSQGKIAKGMSKSAVSLAWGSPDSRAEGLRDGKMLDRWDYEGRKPVVTQEFYGGYGRGIYGPYRYSGVGAGFGPQITYLPYRRSSVWFHKGSVDAWENLR